MNRRIAHIQDCFASTSRYEDAFFIYRGNQRAMGELMMVGADGSTLLRPRNECRGYAAFVDLIKEGSCALWFERVGSEIASLPTRRSVRLVDVQHALVDLIDLLDPDCKRFENSRSRL